MAQFLYAAQELSHYKINRWVLQRHGHLTLEA